jgi:hypothetical protein
MVTAGSLHFGTVRNCPFVHQSKQISLGELLLRKNGERLAAGEATVLSEIARVFEKT